MFLRPQAYTRYKSFERKERYNRVKNPITTYQKEKLTIGKCCVIKTTNKREKRRDVNLIISGEKMVKALQDNLT